VIVIDAFASGEADLRNEKEDPRTTIDRIVDSNFFDSIDAMLSRHRVDTLSKLGLTPPRLQDGNVVMPDFPVPGHQFRVSKQNRISWINPRLGLGEDDGQLVEINQITGKQKTNANASCMIWYLGIDAMQELIASKWKYSEQLIQHENGTINLPEYKQSFFDHMKTDAPKRKSAVWELASRVRTDFNLVGPRNCSREVLSDALWMAGAVSVNADVNGREKVCAWLKSAGLQVSAECDSKVQFDIKQLPIEYVSHFDGNQYSVECK
jgi:hypothetical protein